jgi:nicotinamidase-related amidase
MIEFQNEWLDPAGKLCGLFQDQELLTTTVRNASNALLSARNAGLHIVHTTMGFSRDYRELGHTDFGMRGAIAHHQTWQGHSRAHASGFSPQNDEFVVDRKVGASAFASTALDLYLRNNAIDRIYLAGFALQVCVSATGWAAHDLGYEVVVLEDACAAFNREQQTFVLDNLVHHFGKRLSTTSFQQLLIQHSAIRHSLETIHA